VAKSKRTNYLIDKPFQLGFIVKYVLVLIITIVIFFGLVGLYYFQSSFLGSNFLDQNITIQTRGQLTTQNGNKIFLYDKEKIQVYEKIDNGSKSYFCYKPFDNPKFKTDDAVTGISEKDIEALMGSIPQQTKMFFIVIYPLLWMFIIVILIIALYSLFFSHRMAGPIYRIRVSLDRILSGDYDFNIKVRKNDFFVNIIDKLEALRQKIKNNALTDKKTK
jgi:hypothetical protein